MTDPPRYCAHFPTPRHSPPVRAGHYPDVPVLAISGEFDIATTPGHADTVTARYPNARAVTVPHARHGLLLGLPIRRRRTRHRHGHPRRQHRHVHRTRPGTVVAAVPGRKLDPDQRHNQRPGVHRGGPAGRMTRVTRGLQYFVAWSAATAVSVVLSWLGIRFVLEAGVPERPILVAGPVQQSTAIPTTTTTTVVPTTTTTTLVVVVTTEPPLTTTTTTTTTTPTTTPLPSEQGTWTEHNGEPVYLRSFRLQGGVAAIRFSEHDMEPISATPRQGFAVSVEQPADAVVVDFVGNGHRSRLEASWIGGPQWRVIES